MSPRCSPKIVSVQFRQYSQFFFYIVSQVLDRYHLPTISQILTSSISKLKWKHTYKKAIEAYWTRVYICDIKSEKNLKISLSKFIEDRIHSSRV